MMILKVLMAWFAVSIPVGMLVGRSIASNNQTGYEVAPAMPQAQPHEMSKAS